MRQVTVNVYKFEELSDEIKRIVSDKLYHDILEDRYANLENYLLEYLKENYKLENIDIDYDFGYDLETDEVCIYTKNKQNLINYSIIANKDVNKANIFEKYIIDNYGKDNNDFIKSTNYLKIINYLNLNNKLYIEHDSAVNYSYKICKVKGTFEYNYCELIDELCEKLTMYVYRPLCLELVNYVNSLVNVSEEDILNVIEVNNLEFYENGNIYQK